jgi:RNA polymerase sigma-70 factor, ECF subfamily
MSHTVTSTAIPSARRDAVARLDDASFGAFYERTSRPLWAYVYRVTSHAADADDIVQEAYCRLLRVEMVGDEEAWRRYLYRIASNLITDRWRRSGRDVADAAESTLAEVPAPEASHDRDVAATFDALAKRDRALLWLAYVEGESHADIATSLGVGARSVKVLLFRAKRRLRDLLNARGIGR